MYALLALLFLGLAGHATAHASPVSAASSRSGLLTNVTIFDPPENYTIPRTLYGRSLLIPGKDSNDYTLLATWENYLPNNDSNPYFPIYQSLDKGKTWTERSRVQDTANHLGNRYQPFLYLLEDSIGGFEPGTILLAGNSIPNNLSSTHIELYASKDQGHTWQWVSEIASGGEALPNDGLTPVWEPFLMIYQGQLVCYYSDQRDPKHGQKLVHQTSKDLRHWSAPVDDVAYDTYDFRPGMTTVSELPNGKYIMTYEFYGAPEAAFAVYYRISDSPLAFNKATGMPIVVGKNVPVSSPYNVWTSAGGKNGTIVVSCGIFTQVFVNHKLGAEGAWEMVDTPAEESYSRSLRVLPKKQGILIIGGGPLGGSSNRVTANSIRL